MFKQFDLTTASSNQKEPLLIYQVISNQLLNFVRSNQDLTFETKAELLHNAIEFENLEALDLLSTLYIAARKPEEAYNLVMHCAHKFGLAGQYIKFIILERLANAETKTDKKFVLIYSALRTAIALLIPNEIQVNESIMHHLRAYFEKLKARKMHQDKFEPVNIIKEHIKAFLFRIQKEEELMRLQLQPNNKDIVNIINDLLTQFHQMQDQ
ncbi:MAG: hypothetical protein AAGG80_02305 [Pseudomonadota bacterium]